MSEPQSSSVSTHIKNYRCRIPSAGYKCGEMKDAQNLCMLGKGKAVLLQAWRGPEGFRKLRFPDFMTTAQDGGKVVSLTHQLPLPPRNTPGTHFC